MQSRARVGHEIAVLDDEEVACGVGCEDLEGKRAESEGVKMARAVSSCWDGADWDGIEGRRLRFWRALRENILESGDGDNGGGGFEEGAAVNWHAEIVRQGITPGQ